LFEKGPQSRQIIFTGAQRNFLDVISTQHARKLGRLFLGQIGKTRPCRAISRTSPPTL